MAGAIVGGAFLSSFLNVLFDRMASSQVVAFFKRNKLDDRLLQKLETAMIPAAGLLDVAEEKQIKEPTVQKWLDLLKDAVYEADDLLDEIAYEAQWQKLETERQMQEIFSISNLRSVQIEKKLQDLQERFDYLVEKKDVLDLKDYRGEKRSPHTTPMSRTPSSSLVGEFFGRDVDSDEIMKLLRSKDANGKNPGVVPIVGMGGVGKTALAQHVYNRSEVQKRFDLKAWVCVSEDFSVLKLTKVILEGFGSKPAFDNLDQLQLQLKNSLLKKKFLLVLDDVWNEDYAEWVTLLTPLKGGAQGSKILVTTRNGSVASVMQTVPVHHLKELKERDCWFVFSEHAFRGEDPNAYEELQQIGRAIARKCKGLPLAAKILGGLLRVKRHVKEWRKILTSNLWDLTEDNNILPALRLSYHYLQSHLKQCFAYCAMFPKGYSFRKDELVLLWMAEGFLVHSAVDDEMEEAGAECFDNLLSRSFFQQSRASPSSFVMHDLMHDLAIHVSGQFCFSSQLGGNNSSMATRRTRHLSLEVDTEGGFSSTENIREAQLLRTFRTSPPGWMCPRKFYNEIFQSTHCRLRVLFMTNCRFASMLSLSTINLKHLRYLDLSRSDFVTLPEKVSTFLNLQTLTLKNCKQLASLPDLGNLKHLRHLNLEGTRIESLPASLKRLINLRYLTFNISDTPLKEMPPHIGQLTKLQTLTAFLVGRQSDPSIKELGKLRHLRGELHIKNLQNVVDALDAVEANLKGKEHLDKLRFTWDGDARDPQDVTSSTVLENLEPNRNVKDLRIDGYGGIKFPDWVGESSFSNIVSLELIRCTNCTSLPPLGQLASLEHLSIEEFDKVVTVGSEFYGNCTAMKKPFESLKTLSFRRMQEWREWISDEGSREAFPLLEELSIKECPKLAKALPSHHLPHVTKLQIEECEQLATPLPRFPRLHSLDVSGFHSLESQAIEQMGCSPSDLGNIHIIRWSSLKRIPLNLFPKLNSLSISKCPDLESLCAHEIPLNDLKSLRSLEIRGCPKLVSFPEGGLPASVLTRLELRDCGNLKLLPESMNSLLPSLEHLKIRNCSELELCPKGSFPSKLQSLEIWNCNKLIAGRMQWGLETLHLLSHFIIGGHKNVESFPEEMLLPSSLTSLGIFGLEDLKSLDYKGLQRLTSLRELMIFCCRMLESMPERLPSSLSTLEIQDCPMLKSLPEEGLPSSLSSLVIHTCPKLNKKEYWNKISHIPHKNIDGHEV